MTNLTVVGPSKRVAPINKWKILDSLIFDADNILERFDALDEQRKELLRHAKMIERYEYPDIMTDPALNEIEIERLEKCRQAITLLDPAENYDDDGDFKKAVIGKRIAALLGAYPSGTPSTPEVYTKMLVEHVAINDELNWIILDCACREIERTQKFLPAISEILEIIDRQQELWRKRRVAISGIERRSRDVAEVLAKVRPKIDAAFAERAKKEAAIALSDAWLALATAKKLAIQQQDEAAKTARSLEYAFQRLDAAETGVAKAEAALVKAKERTGPEANARQEGKR